MYLLDFSFSTKNWWMKYIARKATVGPVVYDTKAEIFCERLLERSHEKSVD